MKGGVPIECCMVTSEISESSGWLATGVFDTVTV